MEECGEIDWLNLPRPERIERTKELYQAVRHVATVTGATVETLIEAAYGAPQVFSADPHRNFRKGELAAPKAQTIHRYLEQNHFELARLAAPELFQVNPRTAWEIFLDAHRVESGLSVVPATQLGIARRKPPEEDAAIFRIGQDFLFELHVPVAGHVVAFETYRGVWHPLPLGADERNLVVKVREGLRILPSTRGGTPIPLAEHDDAGLHEFTFLLCRGGRPPTDTKKLIRYAETAPVSAYQARTRIIT